MAEDAMKKKMMILMIVGMLFALTGIVLHVTAIKQEFKVFGPLQESYYGVAKADRDAAATGSALNQQLVEIQKFPPKLMTFKLVGIGAVLVGIFLVLFGILKALTMMPIKLAGVICPECGKKLAKKKK